MYAIEAGRLRFRRVIPPTRATLEVLVTCISERIGRLLERHGLLVRNLDHSYLNTAETKDDAAMDTLRGHFITYRIALGPHEGRKAFTLQTLPSMAEDDAGAVAKTAGFSLHAGVAALADERSKLERLCRYIARPAVSTERLSPTLQGLIHYRLKTPYRDGTTHVVFQPLDARLAALVPKSRVDLTRYHGVFAPHSAWRAQVTPAKRGHPDSK